MNSIDRLTDILQQQIVVQECTDDDTYQAAAEIRDGRLRKLTKRERIQMQLACGILSRLCEDR